MVKWANTQQSSDGSSQEALLKIARDYRLGTFLSVLFAGRSLMSFALILQRWG